MKNVWVSSLRYYGIRASRSIHSLTVVKIRNLDYDGYHRPVGIRVIRWNGYLWWRVQVDIGSDKVSVYKYPYCIQYGEEWCYHVLFHFSEESLPLPLFTLSTVLLVLMQVYASFTVVRVIVKLSITGLLSVFRLFISNRNRLLDGDDRFRSETQAFILCFLPEEPPCLPWKLSLSQVEIQLFCPDKDKYDKICLFPANHLSR